MRVVVKVGVVNYGVGNVGSIFNALRRIGAEPMLINSAVELRSVDAVILPGVGSFNSAMVNLSRLTDELNSVRGSSPILGICLGLQLMFKGSDEGELGGLGWYDGWVNRIRGPRVPHIGWDYVKLNGECNLGVIGGYYYFMHSYAVVNPINEPPNIGFTRYGGSTILSVLCDEGKATYGTQFHPEKSGKLGLSILSGLINLAKS